MWSKISTNPETLEKTYFYVEKCHFLTLNMSKLKKSKYEQKKFSANALQYIQLWLHQGNPWIASDEKEYSRNKKKKFLVIFRLNTVLLIWLIWPNGQKWAARFENLYLRVSRCHNMILFYLTQLDKFFKIDFKFVHFSIVMGPKKVKFLGIFFQIFFYFQKLLLMLYYYTILTYYNHK